MRDERQITKIVAASLLGDASISKDKRDNGNCVFEISLIVEHVDHLEYLKTFIDDITPSTISHPSKNQSQTRTTIENNKPVTRKAQYRLRSKRHPFFTKFRERMYGTGRKSVDPHYLTLLDWEFLAVWYMQDGFNSSGKIALCTNSFSYPECMFLRSKLKEILNLDWNVSRFISAIGNTQYILRLSATQREQFVDGVTPFIQSSFQYKLNRTWISPVKQDEDIVQSV